MVSPCVISLRINDVEHFSCLLAAHVFSWAASVHDFAHFVIRLFVFWLFTWLSSLQILNIRPLSDSQIANIFFHSVSCLFTVLIVSFAVKKLFSLIRSLLSIFAFVTVAFGLFFMKSLCAYVLDDIASVGYLSGFLWY